MKKLVEDIAKALVDYPESVQVIVVKNAGETIFELRTHFDDAGKVIGRQGRIARAIRTLLTASGMKRGEQFTLVIIEPESGRKKGGAAGKSA
jgi:predicted RNA-binding protein YlqC (UPF0109 family)